MLIKEIEVHNARGISSQVATQIVRTAGQYQSSILINNGTKTINAKSIMGVLSMGTGLQGTVRVTVDGRDEAAAADAIAAALSTALG